MDSDNPFAPGSGSQDLKNDADKMQPVAMEPVAILERCWEIVKANPMTVIGTFLITALPQCASNVVSQGMDVAVENSEPEAALGILAVSLGVMIVAGVISLFLQLGAARVYTRLARGIDAEISMLFGEATFFLPALGMSILIGLAVFTGFLLLIIPGIILAMGLQFALYAMIDQNLGPIDAMQESWRLTDGHKLTVFLVNLAIGILTFVFGCVTLGLGFVLAAPVIALSQAVMYHSLMHLQGPRPMTL